ncbi:MAG: FGGY-family carbohydrate kinase, partial [Paracoccaceae bacterium]
TRYALRLKSDHSIGAGHERITVVGGGTRSQLWLRLLASVLNRPVSLIEGADIAGPRGAARLAAVAAGAPMSVLHAAVPVTRTILPDDSLADALAARAAAMAALTVL